jgi:hypothetical protein
MNEREMLVLEASFNWKSSSPCIPCTIVLTSAAARIKYFVEEVIPKNTVIDCPPVPPGFPE